jgi:hypothetical protein
MGEQRLTPASILPHKEGGHKKGFHCTLLFLILAPRPVRGEEVVETAQHAVQESEHVP